MSSYSIEPRTRKYFKVDGFLSFEGYLSDKQGRQLLDAAAKSEPHALETATKKAARKAT